MSTSILPAAPTSPAPPSSAVSAGKQLERLTSPLAALLVLLAFYGVMMAAVVTKSATYDEPGHAAAGYTFWKFNDYRIHPEGGNLAQRWMALPLWWSDFNFRTDSAGWQHGDAWETGYDWLHRSGNDTHAILFRGRAASGLLAVALGWLIWLWSRRRFGAVGGMVSLLFYTLNPVVLANGALIAVDVAAAFGFLAATWCAWRAVQSPTIGRVLASAVAMSVLLLIKLSAAIIIPIAAVMMLLRLAAGAPLALSATRTLSRRGPQVLAYLGATAVHAVVAGFVIWAAYGFRHEAHAARQSPEWHFGLPWPWVLEQPDHVTLLNQVELTAAQRDDATAILKRHGAAGPEWTYAALKAFEEIKARVLTPAQRERLASVPGAIPPGIPGRLIAWARDRRLLPEAYLYGNAFVWKQSARPAFWNGEVSTRGWRGFFPNVFAVKTPLAAMALLLLAAAAAFAAREPRPVRAHAVAGLTAPHGMAPLWVLFVVYWAAAIASPLNIGVRHLLPAFPPLCIMAGAAGRWLRLNDERLRAWRGVPVLASGLLVVLVLEMAACFPNYLAYFNGLVRSATAYRHFVDSSLDWGQDLPALKRYLERHAPPAPRLAYFGSASPRAHGLTMPLVHALELAGHEGTPPLKVVGAPPGSAIVEDALRQDPAFDPGLVLAWADAGRAGTLLVKRPAALRLGAGTYLISATLLQPVSYRLAFGPWNARYEAAYQQARTAVKPMLIEDVAARFAALQARPLADWVRTLRDFEELQFARLTAFLREREPDAHINHSILVFRLSEDDIARALDGPSS